MSETRPNCTRCSADVMAVHPVAWMIVDLTTPLLDDGMAFNSDRSILCATCMLGLGEYLVPLLKDDPEWISGKDQLDAQVRDNQS